MGEEGSRLKSPAGRGKHGRGCGTGGQREGDYQQLLPVLTPLFFGGPCQMQPLAPGVLSSQLGVLACGKAQPWGP